MHTYVIDAYRQQTSWLLCCYCLTGRGYVKQCSVPCKVLRYHWQSLKTSVYLDTTTNWRIQTSHYSDHTSQKSSCQTHDSRRSTVNSPHYTQVRSESPHPIGCVSTGKVFQELHHWPFSLTLLLTTLTTLLLVRIHYKMKMWHQYVRMCNRILTTSWRAWCTMGTPECHRKLAGTAYGRHADGRRAQEARWDRVRPIHSDWFMQDITR